MTVNIQIMRLPHYGDLPLPKYAYPGDAGVDLYAAIDKPVYLNSTERRLVPTGIAIALPPGYEAQVRTRSGMALKHGLVVANSPGTIDSGYRGEISVILYNIGFQGLRVERGDRIAQLVFAPVTRVEFIDVDVLSSTQRSTGGFGSSGKD
jgi:dUTP pyrophosphatase